MQVFRLSILMAFVLFSSNSFAGNHLYIQAAKASLKSEAKMKSSEVISLKRGQKVEVIEKKGMWFHVKQGSHKGWISKLFVSERKPVGKATLNQELSVNLDKASRRRSSSYAVAGATRGLTAGRRVREGRDEYQSDNYALGKMESYKLSPKKLLRFQKRGNLLLGQ